YPSNPSMVMKSIISMNSPNGMMSRNQLSTINQSQLNGQLSLSMAGAHINHTSPSPPASKSATPSPSSSINEDDQEDSNRVIGEKRPAPIDPTKKPKTPKKKKKKDPNEPQKPVSAYALFFRDTQAAIKGQNPNATFGEVSKIVASMWDGLGEEQKQVLLNSVFRLGITLKISAIDAHFDWILSL
ncbi:TOX high mobility group box member 3, partial [Goodea atripinnis]